MSGPKIGELFAGYGGLGMGVQAVLGGEVAWFSEFDKGPSKILEHRFPGVRNYGDITKIKWTPDCPDCGDPLACHDRHGDGTGERFYYCYTCKVEHDLAVRDLDPDRILIPDPVDVLTGGFPCQDVSAAGKRAGLIRGTRSGLWHEFVRAIRALRPSVVVIENVRGLLTARGDTSDEYEAADLRVTLATQLRAWVEDRRTRAVNEGRTTDVQRLTTRTHRLVAIQRRAVADRKRAERRIVRAIGTVLGTLADLGYDARWYGLRAADVGAPHGRFRVFVVAQDATGVRGTEGQLARVRTAAPDVGASAVPDQPDRGPASSHLTLLPTPAVNDMGEGKTVDHWDEWTAKMQAAHGNGNGHGKSLAIEAQRLLPTPTTMDSHASGGGYNGQTNVTLTDATVRGKGMPAPLLQTPSVADALGGHERRGGARGEELLLNGQAKEMHGAQWGDYAAAIARWEQRLYAQDRIAEQLLIPGYIPVGRPAPAPTQTSAKGNPQLSPVFVEWMMGLPAGWVTDVPGITRNEALKALGNGVCPQQAAAALREMFTWAGAAA